MESKLASLRKWLDGLHDEPLEIQDDTDLIQSGVVTSLQFVQMVIEIERLHGRKLDPGVITVESMRTLKAIDAAVFQDA
ncbi:phosphopantetheine-binding protein [Actinokineospora iranica]|uniref:Phosphopantetheine attachment site n=1 Tax=Actinokineospora iranica TaxID=1271860 RepID=A0A1G6IPP0_9PSEU|nr:phosphopantetheine-binding protein [Actinokineospora iranica]SDC07726.1 Phosphopantetheine attachment site [Actinokineospora iranica]